MKKVEFTSVEIHEVENYVINAWNRRAKAQGYKGKKFLDMQAEFMLGMVGTLDALTGAEVTGKSSVSPRVAFSILRDDPLVAD